MSVKAKTTEPEYSIILPTYNEKDNIALIVWLIRKYLQDKYSYEIIVVDDNSPDGTQEVVKKLQKLYESSQIQLRPRSGKLGLGTAYLHGLKHARGSFVILMDADLSHHPKYIPHLIAKQKRDQLDIVTGTRYIQGGGVFGWDFKRKLTSCGANILASVLLQAPVYNLLND